MMTTHPAACRHDLPLAASVHEGREANVLRKHPSFSLGCRPEPGCLLTFFLAGLRPLTADVGCVLQRISVFLRQNPRWIGKFRQLVRKDENLQAIALKNESQMKPESVCPAIFLPDPQEIQHRKTCVTFFGRKRSRISTQSDLPL